MRFLKSISKSDSQRQALFPTVVNCAGLLSSVEIKVYRTARRDKLKNKKHHKMDTISLRATEPVTATQYCMTTIGNVVLSD